MRRNHDISEKKHVHKDCLHTNGKRDTHIARKRRKNRCDTGNTTRSQAIWNFKGIDANGINRRSKNNKETFIQRAAPGNTWKI